MALYLATDTTQPNNPEQPEGEVAERIYDYLYAVDTVQFDSPTRQTLGWGYSTKFHVPVKPDLPVIPPWMAEDYPFVEPSTDIVGFVIDSLLSFEDPLNEFEVPFYLRRITKHKDGLYSVRFVDANERVIFDSSSYEYTTNSISVKGATYTAKATNKKGKCVYKWKEWGDLYELLYWETELVTLKMIIRRTTITSDSAIKQFSLYPDKAELDARAIYQYPKRVRSITVGGSVISPRQLLLQAGYNMAISTDTESDIRTKHTVTLAAIQGAGQGIEPADCTPEDNDYYITSINSVRPTKDGAFFINGDACHSIGGTTAVTIGNGCKPCCKCEDMSALGKLLNTVEDEYYCLGGKYQEIVKLVMKQIKQLTDRVTEEREYQPAVQFELIEGNRLFAPFRLIFRNLADSCTHNLEISLKIENMSLILRQTRQTGPVASDYSDCYVIDTYEEPNVSVGNITTFRWDKPIQTMQQVYVVGMFRLNTHYREYKASIEKVQYYDDDGRLVVLNVGEQEQIINYGPWDFMQFDDFTDLLTGSELNHLEQEVRDRCIADGIDEPVRRSTITQPLNDNSESSVDEGNGGEGVII